jgi:hypothetical protein
MPLTDRKKEKKMQISACELQKLEIRDRCGYVMCADLAPTVDPAFYRNPDARGDPVLVSEMA